MLGCATANCKYTSITTRSLNGVTYLIALSQSTDNDTEKASYRWEIPTTCLLTKVTSSMSGSYRAALGAERGGWRSTTGGRWKVKGQMSRDKIKVKRSSGAPWRIGHELVSSSGGYISCTSGALLRTSHELELPKSGRLIFKYRHLADRSRTSGAAWWASHELVVSKSVRLIFKVAPSDG